MISVQNLAKSFDGANAPVLRGVSFDAGAGDVFTLLGPSGCGKTTLLRCVAGLEHPDDGRIVLGGRTVFSAAERINEPPDRRGIGMVFQSYAIWPHMTVAENVAYPLEGQGIDRKARSARVAAALELIGLPGLGDRPAPLLSGGQQQRVALARAVVNEPSLLLLDEPLSNLDAKLREQMRSELLLLQRRLGHTMLYVTHDQEEALAMSQRIALFRAGEIVEQGPPRAMYESPSHPFTAAFLGSPNFIPCRMNARPRLGERVDVTTAFGRFTAVAKVGETSEPQLFFRPHAVTLGRHADPVQSSEGRGAIAEAIYLGERTVLTVRSGEAVVHLHVHAAEQTTGDIAFAVDPERAIVFVPPSMMT